MFHTTLVLGCDAIEGIYTDIGICDPRSVWFGLQQKNGLGTKADFLLLPQSLHQLGLMAVLMHFPLPL